MKTKKSKRVMAVVMAVLLTVGIMPMDWTVTKAAASTVHSFDATAQASVGDDKAVIAEGTTFNDGYFKIVGKVTQRTNSDGSIKAYELASKAAGAVQFTTESTSSVVVGLSSTGGSNESAVALINTADNSVVAEDAGTAVVAGTKKTELKYTALPAGTYQVVSPEDAERNRACRFFDITVEEEEAAAVTTTYAFAVADLAPADYGVTADKAAIAEGTVFASDYVKTVGTATFRTKSSSDFSALKAIELGSKASGALQFTVTGTASVSFEASSTGGSNESAIALVNTADNSTVAEDAGTTIVKGTNATKLTYSSLPAGTYQIVSPEDADRNRGVRVLSFTAEQTASGERPARKAWEDVAAPAIGEITAADGKITVPFTMVIGYDGADSVSVDMKNAAGTVVATENYAKDAAEGVVTFTPAASGDYTFTITAARKDEADKTGTDKEFKGFELPLAKPSFQSATSQGGGKVSLVWDEVTEASSYEVSYSENGTDFTQPVSVTGTEYVVSGLTVGKEYTFKLTAVRVLPAAVSEAATITAKATAEAQQVWAFSAFGQGVSSDEKNAGYEGSANDGKVTLWNLNSKGKIVPASTDGLSFYYTAIPSNMNFTLSATVTVDEWTLTNGQEGFGLMAADRVGKNGDSSVFWNNSYMASVTKVEYYVNADGSMALDTIKQGGTTAPEGSVKATMKLGIGSQEKTGVTKANLSKLEANDTATVNNEFSSKMTTLESSGVTGNLIGNATKDVTGTVENPLTTFKMSIQKNNTGYFVSYTNEAGETVTKKYYDTKALEQLDEDNVYVGFFASRTAKISVTDINLTTISPENDVAKEEQPVTTVAPSYKVTSASVSNSESYKLSYVANADGHVVVTAADGTVIADEDVTAGQKYVWETTLTLGENTFTVTMTPVEGYRPSEFEVLDSYEASTFTYKVTYNKFDGDVIYVGPDAASDGVGTKENPIDIYTAVKYVSPGQKIVLLSGTYNLESTVTVQPGIDGTESQPIIMAAESSTDRPVFDFGKNCEGMVLAGDHWYYQGFDVTNSANAKDGIRLCGSSCTVDNVRTYHNGNTGLQISRFTSTDTKEEWPSNNLVLNCTSYGNADEGYEDADGFAAKLTIGEGNVFDGCIAYNNADDGWDLFAKVETGGVQLVV